MISSNGRGDRVHGAVRYAWLIVLFTVLLVACSRGGSAPSATPTGGSTAAEPALPIASPTPLLPSPTPVPLAARVNGAGVTLAEYQAELERYRTALGRELTEEDRQRVLDELIDQVLLSQAAVEQGFALDEAGLQARMDDLVGKAGGEEAFNAWLSAQGYDQESFRLALARAVAAAWMRDQLAETTSSSVEQVHARQILFNDAAEANQVLAQLRAGTNFTTLANEYDPLTGGELGWFPRGYLLHPELEAAAFTLQPGEISPVVQTVIGYHILQVVERSTEHPLAPDVRLILQNQAVQEWLQAQRLESEIEILGLN